MHNLIPKCRQKIWTEAGIEFVTEKGMVMIISRVIYGLKSSSAAWRGEIAKNLVSLGYKSSDVDADVCMKQDFKPNGDSYYKYMLCYLLHFTLTSTTEYSTLYSLV